VFGSIGHNVRVVRTWHARHSMTPEPTPQERLKGGCPGTSGRREDRVLVVTLHTAGRPSATQLERRC